MDSTSSPYAAQLADGDGMQEIAAGVGISLVVATLNRRAEVDALFASLLAQTFRRFEVILVDQNETSLLDGCVADAVARGLVVSHLRVRPPDQSAARNAGLQVARFPVVAFPDDDCWYEPDVLERVCHAMQAAECLLTLGCWVERGDEGLGTCRIMAREVLRFKNVIGASMITLFVSTEIARRIGGFDRRFGLGKFYGGGEDTDFLFRAIALVGCAYFVPSIRIHHPVKRRASEGLDLRDVRGRARGLGGLYGKHRLEWWVVLRGLVGPLYRSLLDLRSHDEPVRGFVTSLGRLEGFLAWAFRSSGGRARDGGDSCERS